MTASSRGTVPVLVALVVLGGCFGDEAPPAPAGNDDPPSSVLVEPEPGLLIAENRGAIRGHVANEANLSLAGARVSVVGTDSFMTTGGDGAFLFKNVTIATHVLFVQADGFRSHEQTVEVTRGNVTIVDLFLTPAEDAGAGYRAHVHDYWGGQDTRTIMDEDTTVGGSSYYSCGNTNSTDSTSCPLDAFRIRLPEADPPSLVYPGAKELQLTLAWTQGSTLLSRLGVYYRTPADTALKLLPPRATGSTWAIAVSPGDADNGHQVFTLWEFFVCTCNDVRDAANFRPGGIVGPIHVKIVVVRGEVPLEPPHRDFWGQADMLVLQDKAQVARRFSFSATQNRNVQTHCMRLEGDRLVPPGAARMRLEFSWSYDSNAGSPIDRDYSLVWRTGDQDPARTTMAGFRKASTSQTGTFAKTYEFDLDPKHTDAFYQKRSNWCWLVSETGREADDRDYDAPRSRSFHLGVTVWKDATGPQDGSTKA